MLSNDTTRPLAWLPQHIRDITDPEHPYTLEQLSVVTEEHIDVNDGGGTVRQALTVC